MLDVFCLRNILKLLLKPFLGLVETPMEILHVRYSITARFPVPTSRVVIQSMNVHIYGTVEKEQKIPLKQMKT